jgi:hypothetical protein
VEPLERRSVVNRHDLTKLEKQVPVRAVAALNAASERAAAAKLPRVMVIANKLYRITASGAKELIRALPPRTKAPRGAKGRRV